MTAGLCPASTVAGALEKSTLDDTFHQTRPSRPAFPAQRVARSIRSVLAGAQPPVGRPGSTPPARVAAPAASSRRGGLRGPAALPVPTATPLVDRSKTLRSDSQHVRFRLARRACPFPTLCRTEGPPDVRPRRPEQRAVARGPFGGGKQASFQPTDASLAEGGRVQ